MLNISPISASNASIKGKIMYLDLETYRIIQIKFNTFNFLRIRYSMIKFSDFKISNLFMLKVKMKASKLLNLKSILCPLFLITRVKS